MDIVLASKHESRHQVTVLCGEGLAHIQGTIRVENLVKVHSDHGSDEVRCVEWLLSNKFAHLCKGGKALLHAFQLSAFEVHIHAVLSKGFDEIHGNLGHAPAVDVAE